MAGTRVNLKAKKAELEDLGHRTLNPIKGSGLSDEALDALNKEITDIMNDTNSRLLELSKRISDDLDDEQNNKLASEIDKDVSQLTDLQWEAIEKAYQHIQQCTQQQITEPSLVDDETTTMRKNEPVDVVQAMTLTTVQLIEKLTAEGTNDLKEKVPSSQNTVPTLDANTQDNQLNQPTENANSNSALDAETQSAPKKFMETVTTVAATLFGWGRQSPQNTITPPQQPPKEEEKEDSPETQILKKTFNDRLNWFPPERSEAAVENISTTHHIRRNPGRKVEVTPPNTPTTTQKR